MKPVVTRGWRSARQRSIGSDGGLLTFALSNLVLLGTLGLSGWWMLYHVWKVAREAPCGEVTGAWVVVLGARLRHDRVSAGYARRLRRAAGLYRVDPRRHILLAGGQTGGSVSEAERGREFLLDLGVPRSSLHLEDQSLNTLDNLRRARQLFPSLQEQPFTLVTSRHHLARSAILAHGLGLRPILCAAEELAHLDPILLWRCSLEAYYLHWYLIGKTWSRWTQNHRGLARIS